MQSDENKSFYEAVQQLELALIAQEASPLNLVLSCLDHVSKFCASGGLRERGLPPNKVEHWYTRLAAAITTVVVNPQTLITQALLREICRRKQMLVYIFNASGYRDMQHLVSLMSQKTSEGNISIKRDRAAVLLAFLGLDDVSDVLMATALQQPPAILFELMIGWLNQRAVLTAQGERNRTALLLAGDRITDYQIADRDIQHMVNAWMYSTYADTPRKHDIKKAFNKMFVSLLDRAGIRPPSPELKQKRRPRVLVIHERFIKMHAMYRCYAAYVRGLNRHFEVHALAEEMWIDEASNELFQSITRLEKDSKRIKDIVEIIADICPDIIWYPSLGMSHWTVLLANLRLAPLQIMTHGHPATSCSEAMDYLYLTTYRGDPSECHSEEVLVGSATSISFDPHTDLSTCLPPLADESEREVRVAVNSKVMKLSSRLMNVCKELNRKAEYPLKFVFFPGERHLYFDGLASAISNEIPNSVVMPYMSYERFLREISQCDLALAAFPFGNTNGTVDTCLLGLPTVAHFGPETPAQSDSLVMKTAGYPDWCVCETDTQYLTAALRIVNDPALRAKLKREANREEIRDALVGSGSALVYESFADRLISEYRKKEDQLT